MALVENDNANTQSSKYNQQQKMEQWLNNWINQAVNGITAYLAKIADCTDPDAGLARYYQQILTSEAPTTEKSAALIACLMSNHGKKLQTSILAQYFPQDKARMISNLKTALAKCKQSGLTLPIESTNRVFSNDNDFTKNTILPFLCAKNIRERSNIIDKGYTPGQLHNTATNSSVHTNQPSKKLDSGDKSAKKSEEENTWADFFVKNGLEKINAYINKYHEKRGSVHKFFTKHGQEGKNRALFYKKILANETIPTSERLAALIACLSSDHGKTLQRCMIKQLWLYSA